MRLVLYTDLNTLQRLENSENIIFILFIIKKL